MRNRLLATNVESDSGFADVIPYIIPLDAASMSISHKRNNLTKDEMNNAVLLRKSSILGVIWKIKLSETLAQHFRELVVSIEQ